MWQVAWHNIRQGAFDPDSIELWQKIVLARVSTNTFANVDDTFKDNPDTPRCTPKFVFASGSRANVDLAASTTILDIKLQLATSLNMDPCNVDLIAHDRVLCSTESVNVISECDIVQIVFNNRPLIMGTFRYYVFGDGHTSMWRRYLCILRPDLDPETVQGLQWRR